MPLQRKRSWMNWDGCEPVAAWQPLYAPSFQDSLWNWRNRFATVGENPSFTPAGWVFSGAQYLRSGIVASQDQSWSFLISYCDVTFNDAGILGSYRTTSDAAFATQLAIYTQKGWFYNGLGYPNVAITSYSIAATGIVGIAGRSVYNDDGVVEASTIPASPASGAMGEIYIGALNYHDATDYASYFLTGTIRGVAIWDVTLTPAQMWLRWHMLAHLANSDWNAWAPVRRWFFIPPPVSAAATPALSTIYINSADIGDTSLFDDVSGAVISTSYARTGTSSFQLHSDSDYLTANLTSSPTKYTKFGFLVSDTPPEAARLCAWHEDGTEHVSLWLTGDLQLEMRQGSTIIQSSPSTLEINAWYCIETKIVVHDTVGRFQVRIDGVDDMVAIGICTDADVDGAINQIRFEPPAGDTFFDDIVVREDQWCGTGGVYVVVPAAAGRETDWSGSYADINDLPPSFADYIAATPGDGKATFRHQGLTIDYAQMPIVGVFAKARLDAAADAVAYAAAFSNEEFATGDAQDLDTTGVYARLLMTTNPDGSAVWTAAAVDAMEIGIKA